VFLLTLHLLGSLSLTVDYMIVFLTAVFFSYRIAGLDSKESSLNRRSTLNDQPDTLRSRDKHGRDADK
jgi:hypothetical protein